MMPDTASAPPSKGIRLRARLVKTGPIMTANQMFGLSLIVGPSSGSESAAAQHEPLHPGQQQQHPDHQRQENTTTVFLMSKGGVTDTVILLHALLSWAEIRHKVLKVLPPPAVGEGGSRRPPEPLVPSDLFFYGLDLIKGSRNLKAFVPPMKLCW